MQPLAWIRAVLADLRQADKSAVIFMEQTKILPPYWLVEWKWMLRKDDLTRQNASDLAKFVTAQGVVKWTCGGWI